MKNNQYSDLEHLELVASRIAESGVDITSQYQDWIEVTFACASLGESARESFHKISSQYPGYQREECDRCFDNCLRTGRGDISLGTLFKLAQDHGVDTSLPRGPRPKTEAQKKKENENRFRLMQQYVREWFDVRFNTWKGRVDICERHSDEWRPITDRDLSTIYARLRAVGVCVTVTDVKALMQSRDFAEDYDVVATWFESLKPYDPTTDPDYIADFFAGHLTYGDPENADYYQKMLKKWFVAMVGLWTGRIRENPIMPVFCGAQHIGKTYYIRHLLPPSLREYYKEPNPSDPVDKDFLISLSEVVMVFLDEFSIMSSSKSNAYKAIITSTQSNLRDSFGHFREIRLRKASLIGATNYQRFIHDCEGNRRYLSINLAGTANLNDHPLPYEGAYAQALWLLDNGFDPKPTQQESADITAHNADFMEPNDCEEALKVFVQQPAEGIRGEALSAGELLQELGNRGFRGAGFSAQAVGKAMRSLGFKPKKVRGNYKYRVILLTFDSQKAERLADDDSNEVESGALRETML